MEDHHSGINELLQTDPSIAATTDATGRNALHLATIDGDLELIRLVLPNVDVNAVDNEKHTALHWAAVCGFHDCISLLIESGCNPATPDLHGVYPIHYVTQLCSDPSTAVAGLHCLQALLRKGGSSVNCVDNTGKTPLLWAASSGSAHSCRLLVDLKADITIRDDNGLTAVHCATCRNHPDCLGALLKDCQCDPNAADKKGCTSIFYAITMEHQECAEILLKYGASPNWQDENGKSPAFLAAARGSIPFLKLLHEYNASLGLHSTDRETPLTQAVKAGHTDAVSFLLEHEGDVRTRDMAGQTLLHLAASRNNILLCKLLVHHKANINSVYKKKQKAVTPLDCAEEKSSVECVNYLRSMGAKHGKDIPENLWPSDELEHESRGTKEEKDSDAREPINNMELCKTNNDVHTSARKPRSSDLGKDVEDLQRKLKDWNAYLQGSVEFLDIVIDSNAPELCEARRRAQGQKKDLVGSLNKLKTELEMNCRTLVKDAERKERHIHKRSEVDADVIRKLQEIEEQLKKANTSAAASLDEYFASQAKPAEKSSKYRGGDDHDDCIEKSLPNTTDRYDTQGQRKNRENPDKKGDIQGSPSSKLVSKPARRTRSVPDYRTVKSPYNAKVILPLRLPEPPRRRHNNENQISGHEQAEIRRMMGEINNATLYPKTSLMRLGQLTDLYDSQDGRRK